MAYFTTTHHTDAKRRSPTTHTESLCCLPACFIVVLERRRGKRGGRTGTAIEKLFPIIYIYIYPISDTYNYRYT